MVDLARPTLRFVVAPAALAATAVYEGWSTDPLAAAGVGWCLFVLCVIAVAVWGKIRLGRARRRLRSVRRRVGTGTS